MRIILSFSFFLLINVAWAQSVSGRLIDQSDKQPLEYSSIALYTSADSLLLTGTVSNTDGNFSIDNIDAGRYYLAIQFVGYQTKYISNLEFVEGKKLNLGKIELTANQELLEEIRITGQKAAAYHKIDRQVFDATQFQNSQGGSATDLIRNLPSVSVNGAGDISVRGSTGFAVLLNGRPVQTAPAVLLNQLPSNAIEAIEIITAPSAKYDPEGKAGLINIITKKGFTDGLYIQINGKYGLPSIEDYDNAEPALRHGADFALNYLKQKWDLSLGGAYLRNDIAGRRVGDVWTIIDDKYTRFPSDGERSFDEYSYSGRFTLGYTPDQQNNFSLGFYAGERSKDRTADILYDHNYALGLPENDTLYQLQYYNENLRIRRGDFILGSLDYQHVFKDESRISGSVLYEYTLLGGPTTNLNLSWPGLQDTLQDQYNTNDNPLHGFRVMIDYVKPVKAGKLEMGYQFRSLDHTGDFIYQERQPGTNNWFLIPEFSSTVDLSRHIHSVYGQFSGKLNQLEFSAGLRAEVMNRDLLLRNQFVDTTYHYDFLQFYPSANLLYDFSGDFQLKAGYSRRVERTTTFKMNPFPEREHSETLEQGDPELLPEFINIFELGMIRDFESNSAFITAYYRQVDNLINRVNTVYNDTILNRIYSNVGQGRSYGLEMGFELNPFDWWQLFAGGNIYNYQIKGTFDQLPVNTTATVYSINANTSFKMSPSFSVQWSVNYLSDRNTAQGQDSRFLSPNLTLRKTFLNDKLAATMQWLNMDMGLLPTNEQRITTWREGEFYTTTNYVYEVDMLLLNLSYTINPANKKARFIKSEFGEKEF
ncbi:MAG: TonB-dependent receptor domain-containing protein [Candidatus Cyclobacteriaceae bacterium M3_2C_046]